MMQAMGTPPWLRNRRSAAAAMLVCAYILACGTIYWASLAMQQQPHNDGDAPTFFTKENNSSSILQSSTVTQPPPPKKTMDIQSFLKLLENNGGSSSSNSNNKSNNTVMIVEKVVETIVEQNNTIIIAKETTYNSSIQSSTVTQPPPPPPITDDRCALCFFGLPRSYKDMVLPSIVKNVLIPNAHHNCDVFVHFYHQYEEPSGRKNRGGTVDPNEIRLLEQAAKDVQNQYTNNNGPNNSSSSGGHHQRMPHVAFTNDTEAQFLTKRGALLKKYHETVGPNGKPSYFPWSAHTYHKSSLDNIVKQWHSIQSVFELMDNNAHAYSANEMHTNVKYTRVGMFRSDVMFLTPIDILATLVDSSTSSGNQTTDKFAVVPGFAMMPVNDRMIYGPYDAVKIWATQRFQLIEERVLQNIDPGYAMHSEKFLNNTVFPAIKAAGFGFHVNKDICFIRTRAGHSAMISDCNPIKNAPQAKGLVEKIVQKECTQYQMGKFYKLVGCGDGINYTSGK